MGAVAGVIFLLEDAVFERRSTQGGEEEVDVTLRPGLADLLYYLHDCQIPVGVATMSTKARLEARLARASIAGFFDVVAGADSRAGRTGEGAVLAEAAMLLGCPLARTLVVAARAEAVEAGCRAGAPTVALAGDARLSGKVLAKAKTTVSDLGEAIDLIEEGRVARG